MCGIAGLADHPQSARATLGAMLRRIAHRGPDDSGIWVDDHHGIALGHRRLSIIDTSSAGHQPMGSVPGRYWLTYNGEIYNYKDLRAELERSGHAPSWRGHSDTEVLLAGFEAWGIEATLKRCNGMFALVAWDRIRGELSLARDRMGEKPLYFGWVGGRFCFASELKALAAMPGWAPTMDAGAIDSFLAAGYVRGPKSAVQGVYRLPAGCLLKLPVAALERALDWDSLASGMTTYWSLAEAACAGSNAPVDATSATQLLEDLLSDSVRLRMVGDVPVGAFLSGGIDSSLVVALMQSQSMRPIHSFSIGFSEPEFDEAPYAEAVARHLGTDHTTLYVHAADALALVPRLAETFDEPFADTSQLPTMLVSELARRHVTVALSGDGGDELFAGYARYFDILDLHRGLSRIPGPLRRFVPPLLTLASACATPVAALSPARRQLPFRLTRLRDRVSAGDPDAMRLAFIGAGGTSRMFARPPARDLSHCFPPKEIGHTLRRLMYADQSDYLPDDILHKVDRSSMAYSLEARVPLLDHRLVELSWRLSTPALVAGRQGKRPLRTVLERHVPKALIERPKQGFAPPMAAWLRGPLRDWADALLSTESLRELPMLDERGVRSLWRSHLAGTMDASLALWNVLMLADWRKRFAATV